MKRAKLRGLKRNAAVVLGNIGNADDIDVLGRALDDSDSLVREHVAWALQKSVLAQGFRRERNLHVARGSRTPMAAGASTPGRAWPGRASSECRHCSLRHRAPSLAGALHESAGVEFLEAGLDRVVRDRDSDSATVHIADVLPRHWAVLNFAAITPRT